MLSVRYLSICPVMVLYCGQTVGWIKMKLGMEVGLGPVQIVLDGDPAPPTQRGTAPHFSAHVCCGKTAGWITMQLGTEVGLDPRRRFVGWGPNSPKKREQHPFTFRPVYCGQTAWMDQDMWPVD